MHRAAQTEYLVQQFRELSAKRAAELAIGQPDVAFFIAQEALLTEATINVFRWWRNQPKASDDDYRTAFARFSLLVASLGATTVMGEPDDPKQPCRWAAMLSFIRENTTAFADQGPLVTASLSN